LIEIDQTDEQRNVLEKLNSTFRVEFGKVKIDTQYIFTLLAKSLQVCDGFIQQTQKDEEGNEVETSLETIETKKDEALVEILEEIDIRKNKVVIWCAFLFSVAKVAKILKKLGVPVLTLTGKSEDTNKIVSMFQKTKEYNVLICTQKKAAESVTLTEAKYAIYYSNIWSNDARMNSEARIRRKGSEKHDSIVYVDLVTKGTVERKVYDCLRKKKDLIEELKQVFLGMKGDIDVTRISK
jgi:SNF2 family DNA or RNA helicase